MALSLIGDSGAVTIHDKFSVGPANQIKLVCKTKGAVICILSGAITTGANAHWEGLFTGSGKGSAIVSLIDDANAIFGGGTIRQPWFGRKIWKGTDALSFSIPYQFLAISNAKTEVYDPFVRLLSFMYPRINTNDPDPLFANYIVPGPSVFYNQNKPDNKGDVVEIYVGTFMHFSACYLESVTCTIQPTFTENGWPTNISGSITFSTVDVQFVQKDGSFMDKGINLSSTYDMDNIGSDFINAVGDMIKNMFSK